MKLSMEQFECSKIPPFVALLHALQSEFCVMS